MTFAPACSMENGRPHSQSRPGWSASLNPLSRRRMIRPYKQGKYCFKWFLLTKNSENSSQNTNSLIFFHRLTELGTKIPTRQSSFQGQEHHTQKSSAFCSVIDTQFIILTVYGQKRLFCWKIFYNASFIPLLSRCRNIRLKDQVIKVLYGRWP